MYFQVLKLQILSNFEHKRIYLPKKLSKFLIILNYEKY